MPILKIVKFDVLFLKAVKFKGPFLTVVLDVWLLTDVRFDVRFSKVEKRGVLLWKLEAVATVAVVMKVLAMTTAMALASQIVQAIWPRSKHPHKTMLHRHIPHALFLNHKPHNNKKAVASTPTHIHSGPKWRPNPTGYRSFTS